jgi:GTP cyclohydrolase II
MVYNRRKRGGDNASEYFNNTAMVAGVKDARHQALMPDVLHFLGINRIDNLISMSNLKYDAIVKSGIKVGKRYEIPDELIPADSRVEIDAKVCLGLWNCGQWNTQEQRVWVGETIVRQDRCRC